MSQKIFQQIPKIMAEVEPIAKTMKNQQQGYFFRSIDQIYGSLQAVMAKHGVFTVPQVIHDRVEERQTKSGSNLIYRVLLIKYLFYADDGSFVESIVVGEGMDSGDKASNKAMSVAHKYALLQVFCIPTEEPKDPENDSQESSQKVAPKASPKPANDKPARDTNTVTASQLKPLLTFMQKYKIAPEDVRKITEKHWGVKSAMELTQEQYFDLCNILEQEYHE